MSSKEGSPGITNPMLYDPMPEGDHQTNKLMQFVAATIVSLGAVAAGTALAWTSPVLPQITNVNATLYVTADEGSWIGSLLAIGAFVGAFPAGILADKIGRKLVSMGIGIPFLISWILIILANGPGMLMAGRFFAGIATGAVCVIAPMFISEIADISVRGALGAFFQLFLTIGILIVYLVGAYTDYVTLSIVCGIVPVLLIVFMFIVPESPTYLLKQDRRNDATISLKWFWGQQCNAREALQAIQNDLDQSTGNASIKDLVTKKGNRTALVISLLLMFFQQLSGINAVIFYTQPIFDSAGSTLDPSICSIIVGVVQVIMTFVSAVLIERAGRRILLLQSSIIMGLCLVALGIYFNLKDHGHKVDTIGWLPLVSVVTFIISFSLGFGPIPWMMMGELFAPDVKGLASSIAVMFNWTLVFIVTKTFGPLNEHLGADVTFWIFAVWMVICTIFVAIKVPETKGKTNAQIQMILSGK